MSTGEASLRDSSNDNSLSQHWYQEGSVTLRASNGQPYSISQMVQLISQQQTSQQMAKQEFVAMELPAYIFVETRFITKNSAQIDDLLEINFVDSAAANFSNTLTSMHPFPVKSHKMFANAEVMASIVSKEIGTITDSENPKRNRFQQTENSTAEIGIQCNMEVDLDFDAEQDAASRILIESSKLKFMEYTCENSILHSNGSLECRICGEIKMNIKAIESHLAFHYGPRVLCYRCGLQFENKNSFRVHSCSGKTKKNSSRLFCPYYQCSAKALSALELFDHLNEHYNDCCYECTVCSRTYHTISELRQHMKLRDTCFGSKQGIHNPYNKLSIKESNNRINHRRVQLVYKLNGTKALRVSRLEKCFRATLTRQCQICLMVCSNDFKLKRHKKRCLTNYCFRYKKKMQSFEQNSDLF